VRAERLAAVSKPVIDEAASQAIDATGYCMARRGFDAMATNAGLFAHDAQTGAEFTVTARNRSGTWSGWAGRSDHALRFARYGALSFDKEGSQCDPSQNSFAQLPPRRLKWVFA
jgi:hypothetical protein